MLYPNAQLFSLKPYSELTKDIPSNPEDLNVVMIPLYHTFGISAIFENMVRGLRFVLIPHYSFKNMLEAIQEYRVSHQCPLDITYCTINPNY